GPSPGQTGPPVGNARPYQARQRDPSACLLLELWDTLSLVQIAVQWRVALNGPGSLFDWCGLPVPVHSFSHWLSARPDVLWVCTVWCGVYNCVFGNHCSLYGPGKAFELVCKHK